MPVTLTKAIHDFFRKKPNQTLVEFQNEIRALDAEDRAYFVREFAKTLGEFQNEIRALTPQDREYFVREFAKIGIEVE